MTEKHKSLSGTLSDIITCPYCGYDNVLKDKVFCEHYLGYWESSCTIKFRNEIINGSLRELKTSVQLIKGDSEIELLVGEIESSAILSSLREQTPQYGLSRGKSESGRLTNTIFESASGTLDEWVQNNSSNLQERQRLIQADHEKVTTCPICKSQTMDCEHLWLTASKHMSETPDFILKKKPEYLNGRYRYYCPEWGLDSDKAKLLCTHYSEPSYSSLNATYWVETPLLLAHRVALLDAGFEIYLNHSEEDFIVENQTLYFFDLEVELSRPKCRKLWEGKHFKCNIKGNKQEVGSTRTIEFNKTNPGSVAWMSKGEEFWEHKLFSKWNFFGND